MKIKKQADGQLKFQCPGCNKEHVFGTGWEFDNNYDNPTVSPSILVTGTRYNYETNNYSEAFRCHSFIKNGKIEFLGDCSHGLKNQTVELPEYDVELSKGRTPELTGKASNCI